MPKPMRVWPAIRRPMLVEPGTMAAPTKESTQQATSSNLRLWKISDAEHNGLMIAAWTSTGALTTHVVSSDPPKSAAMAPTWTADVSVECSLGSRQTADVQWWGVLGWRRAVRSSRSRGLRRQSKFVHREQAREHHRHTRDFRLRALQRCWWRVSCPPAPFA